LAKECSYKFARCECDLNLALSQNLVGDKLEMVSPVPNRLPTVGSGYVHQRHLTRVH
jgi:hypothetical protein